jgi:hypothetical protein
MTNDELDLLRQIESTGTSFVPQSGGMEADETSGSSSGGRARLSPRT